MGLFERITKFFTGGAVSKTAPPGSTPVRSAVRYIKYALPRWMRGDYTLQNSELIFSAVSRIANSLSAMPVQLYRGSKPVRNDLNDLVSFSPNPNMTRVQFFKTLEANRDTYGNAYALKTIDPLGKLERIDILDPSYVKPVLEEDSEELWYKITTRKGKTIYVHNFYVLHIPFISANGYDGINPVQVLYGTLRYADDIETFSKEQLAKGINAQIVLEAPANLGADTRAATIKDLLDTYKDTGGNLLLLESGVTAKSLNMSPVDAKLFEVEKISRSRVAMVYNIPPHLLGDYSDTSFSSQEQQMLEFLMLTMLPIVTAYEAELNRKLLTAQQRKNGYHFKFRMDAILRADAATAADVNFKAVRSGYRTIDEIRGENGDPPLPKGAGQKAFISKDLATVEGLVQYYAANPSNLAGDPATPPQPTQPSRRDGADEEESDQDQDAAGDGGEKGQGDEQ